MSAANGTNGVVASTLGVPSTNGAALPADALQQLSMRLKGEFTAPVAAAVLSVSVPIVEQALEAWKAQQLVRITGSNGADDLWTITSAPASTSFVVPPTPPSCVSSLHWTIKQEGSYYQIDVGLPQQLPYGPVLGPAFQGKLAARRSGAAIAGALLRATVNRQGPLAWIGGKFVAYDRGAFRPLDDGQLRELLMSWDGMSIGAQNDKLSVSASLAGDALSCLRDILAAPSTRFFADAPEGIAFPNVFVTIEKGRVKLKRPSPANRARHWIDVPYRRGASCRRFDRFLREVMMPAGKPKNVCDLLTMVAEAATKIQAFWEWLGCALLGRATSFGKALLLWGMGGSGKSTLLMIVSALWPAELRSAYALQALEDKFNRAALAGKRINICGELPAADADVVESIKAIITGRDDIEARHPFERGFSFRPTAAHLIAANRLPLIGDFTGAFFERFLVLRAEQKFRDTKGEDHELADKIIRSELGAVAAKAITHGAIALKRGRLTIPESSKAAIEDWMGMSDSVRAWYGEMCDPSKSEGLGGDRIYAVYRAWAGARGYRPLAANLFASHLRAMGLTPERTNAGTIWPVKWRDAAAANRLVFTVG